jgi:hypothetical protein
MPVRSGSRLLAQSLKAKQKLQLARVILKRWADGSFARFTFARPASRPTIHRSSLHGREANRNRLFRRVSQAGLLKAGAGAGHRRAVWHPNRQPACRSATPKRRRSTSVTDFGLIRADLEGNNAAGCQQSRNCLGNRAIGIKPVPPTRKSAQARIMNPAPRLRAYR